jgi:antitoxin MazE
MRALHRTKTRIISIGNSKGVRLPKTLLEQSGLSRDVELEVGQDQIIIRSAAQPRQGWEQAFQALAAGGADRLLDDDLTGTSSWDREEWEW